MSDPNPFRQQFIARDADTLAPDGSEIRFMPQLSGGSMVHCRLPAGGVSKAVRHQTVEEIWYILQGSGAIFRRQEKREEITPLTPGLALTIPLGTHFQFRADVAGALDILIVTMPPWPGDDEAVPVADHWPVTSETGTIPA